MLRRQIYLTEKQTKTLGKISKELGISMSEWIRRVIDHHINKRDKKLPDIFDDLGQ